MRVISVPYDSGHRNARMGRGPEYLLENGLKNALLEIGDAEVRVLKSEGTFTAEVAMAFELDRLISLEVRDCLDSGDFPLIISGNCNNSVGTMAGIGCERLGVVWLDGHVDFNTPEMTTTGFSDNMGISIAVGDCWTGMVGKIPEFSPVEKRNVVIAGAREIESAEQTRLNASDITLFRASNLKSPAEKAKLVSALKELGDRTRAVYLHLDLDVLDPESVGQANEFAPTGGLTTEEAEAVISLSGEYCQIAALGVASYDPALDHDNRILQAAIRLIGSLIQAAKSS